MDEKPLSSDSDGKNYKFIMPWIGLQGMINNVRFTFSVSVTTWAVNNQYWAGQIELLTLNTIYSVVPMFCSMFVSNQFGVLMSLVQDDPKLLGDSGEVPISKWSDLRFDSRCEISLCLMEITS